MGLGLSSTSRHQITNLAVVISTHRVGDSGTCRGHQHASSGHSVGKTVDNSSSCRFGSIHDVRAGGLIALVGLGVVLIGSRHRNKRLCLWEEQVALYTLFPCNVLDVVRLYWCTRRVPGLRVPFPDIPQELTLCFSCGVMEWHKEIEFDSLPVREFLWQVLGSCGHGGDIDRVGEDISEGIQVHEVLALESRRRCFNSCFSCHVLFSFSPVGRTLLEEGLKKEILLFITV